MGQDLMEWLLENADFDHRNGYQFKKVISMITRYRAVMEQAVDALEAQMQVTEWSEQDKANALTDVALTALREALNTTGETK